MRAPIGASVIDPAGETQATYIYDANEQLAIRDSIAAPVGVTHYIHDIFGNPGLRRGRLNR